MTKYQKEQLAAKSILARAGFTSASAVRLALEKTASKLRVGARDSRYDPEVAAYEEELRSPEKE